MFTERKIEKFQQTISALPDTPNLSAAELKRRFDACPEELRKALNGVCDDGAALEKRMDAYRAETFEGEITRDMLAPAVQGEISGKAEQTALDAETAAREKTDETLQTAVAKKCEVHVGTYTGNGAASQMIALGFTPVAVFCIKEGYQLNSSSTTYGGFAVTGFPAKAGSTKLVEIKEGGFIVYESDNRRANGKGILYHYMALR